ARLTVGLFALTAGAFAKVSCAGTAGFIALAGPAARPLSARPPESAGCDWFHQIAGISTISVARTAATVTRGQNIVSHDARDSRSSFAPVRAISSCRRARIGFGILGSSPNCARRAFASASSICSMGFFGSDAMLLSIRRQTIVRWENFLSDIEQAIQAFAQSRAYCFWVKTQFR